MAEERNDSREMTWRTLLPWTELFRGFQIALDPNKLFLAAIGIVLMAVAWWFLALIFGLFYGPNPPDFNQDYLHKPGVEGDTPKMTEAWANYIHDRHKWNLMQRATGMGNKGGKVQKWELEDLVTSKHDYDIFMRQAERRHKKAEEDKTTVPNKYDEYRDILATLPADEKLEEDKDQLAKLFNCTRLGTEKPHSELNTLPWYENRGPNPFLLITGQAGRQWEAGHFWEWFLTHQLPVVIEPLVEAGQAAGVLLQLTPTPDGLPALYFLPGVRGDGGHLVADRRCHHAHRPPSRWRCARRRSRLHGGGAASTLKRLVLEYLMAPVYPLEGFIVVLIIFRDRLRPVAHDPALRRHLRQRPLLAGADRARPGDRLGGRRPGRRLAAHGADDQHRGHRRSWEALSRSFSYVFQKPFHYLWYATVAVCYAAVLIFFVGFIGSFTVYLSKWAVEQTPFIKMTNRDPVYLFVYAPESFGWREVLLNDKLVNGDPLVKDGQIQPEVYNRYALGNPSNPDNKDELWGWNKASRGNGGVLAVPRVPADDRLRLQSVLEPDDDHLFPAAAGRGRGRDGRGVFGGGRARPGLQRTADAAARTPPPTKPDVPGAPTMVESPTLRTSGPTATTPLPASTPTAAAEYRRRAGTRDADADRNGAGSRRAPGRRQLPRSARATATPPT